MSKHFQNGEELKELDSNYWCTKDWDELKLEIRFPTPCVINCHSLKKLQTTGFMVYKSCSDVGPTCRIVISTIWSEESWYERQGKVYKGPVVYKRLGDDCTYLIIFLSTSIHTDIASLMRYLPIIWMRPMRPLQSHTTLDVAFYLHSRILLIYYFFFIP